jgi:hypothetical protein
MSLLYLVHKRIVIKFSDSAHSKFKPDAPYAFRLAGVDGMGFLQLQDIKPTGEADHEVTSEPYWINKDLVREIHELDAAMLKEPLLYNGYEAKPKAAATPADAARRLPTSKVDKVKSPKQRPTAS